MMIELKQQGVVLIVCFRILLVFVWYCCAFFFSLSYIQSVFYLSNYITFIFCVDSLDLFRQSFLMILKLMLFYVHHLFVSILIFVRFIFDDNDHTRAISLESENSFQDCFLCKSINGHCHTHTIH